MDNSGGIRDMQKTLWGVFYTRGTTKFKHMIMQHVMRQAAEAGDSCAVLPSAGA